MGDFGPRFLAALAGQASGIGGPTSPVGVVPPEVGGEVNPGMRMFGMNPSDMIPPVGSSPGIAGGHYGGVGQGPTERWDPPVPGGGQQGEVDAVVAGFKPKKISFWGALGDQLLKHWGNKPAFSERIDNVNMQRAMEGFTQDPLQAIRRIGQIPGMQGKAWDLMNTYVDNKRADDQFQRLYGNDQEKTLKNASGLAGIALANPATRPAAIARYNQILRAKGLDQFTLADDVDDATLAAIAGGAIPPTQQEQLELKRLNLERQDRNTESQIERREAQTRQGDARLNQSQQRIDIEKKNPGGGRRKAVPRVVMTPAGNQFIIHPSGLGGILTKPDGTTYEMIKFGNGWKIRPPKEKNN